MYRSPTKLAGLILITFACGSPGELDETRFPAPGETGYADDPAKLGQAGRGGSGTGGSAGNGSGGTAGSGNGTGGSSGGGSAGTLGQGGAGGQASPGCPDDITMLFNRPGPQGGCGGPACHVPNGQSPDLTSPGVVDRLLNVTSSNCGQPYISASYSLLESKLTGDPPDCGSPMPFLTPNALSAADEQCILDWIDEVAGN